LCQPRGKERGKRARADDEDVVHFKVLGDSHLIDGCHLFCLSNLTQ
jgi:hypothetical protein